MPAISRDGVFCVGCKSQNCFIFHPLSAQAIKSGYVLACSFSLHRSELIFKIFHIFSLHPRPLQGPSPFLCFVWCRWGTVSRKPITFSVLYLPLPFLWCGWCNVGVMASLRFWIQRLTTNKSCQIFKVKQVITQMPWENYKAKCRERRQHLIAG